MLDVLSSILLIAGVILICWFIGAKIDEYGRWNRLQALHHYRHSRSFVRERIKSRNWRVKHNLPERKWL